MTTIYIKYGYRGAPTGEVYLPVGEHEVSEGLAEYLIEAGHAVLATPAPVEAQVVVEDVPVLEEVVPDDVTISEPDDEPQPDPEPKPRTPSRRR